MNMNIVAIVCVLELRVFVSVSKASRIHKMDSGRIRAHQHSSIIKKKSPKSTLPTYLLAYTR